MKRIKILSALLCLTTVCSFAGCSANTPANTASSSTEETSTASSEETSSSSSGEAAVTMVDKTEGSRVNIFFERINFLEGFDTFEVTSSDLIGDNWADSFSTTTAGDDASPQLSWKAVEGATSYVVYMFDQFGTPVIHWLSNGITDTELPTGWAPKSEYIGPVRHADKTAHPYVIYVVALRSPVEKAPGDFYNGNYKFEEKILDLDTDGKGNKGNIISYGRLVGYYAGEENPDPSEWVAWVTGD